MPLDPILARLGLDGSDAPALAPPVDLDERRAAADAGLLLAHTGPEPGVTKQDRVIAGVPVREYLPDDTHDPSSTFLYFHGGGWFQGNLDTAEVEMGPMASLAGCRVVSVQYRLAPEHPFPAALDDCVAVYEALVAEGGKIAVGGTSAGANLAAALCLAVRDRGLPQPVLQLLDAPCLDLTFGSASIEEFRGDPLERQLEEFAGFYASDRADRLVSPLLAEDLSGLAPAVITVAELDPVRDDGERYLTRLHAAGVPGTCVRVQAMFHIGWVVPFTVAFRLVNDLRAAALRRAFDGTLLPFG
ncbi:MAG: acetyl esterase [Actinomycetota bacterium]|jgi:acetyl esterase